MADGIGRSKDGVPQWSGEAASFQDYEDQCLQWEQSIAYNKRYLAAPRLIGELSGTARKYVAGKRPDWVSFPGGVSHLMQHLRRSLGKPQIPELSEHLNRFFKNSRRRKFETMNDYIVRKTEVVLTSQTGIGPCQTSLHQVEVPKVGTHFQLVGSAGCWVADLG